MKVIPAIDLINGKTVRLVQGDYGKKLDYDIDPMEAARKWESMGAELIHVVDLDGAKAGHPANLSILRKITKAVDIPVEIGGGYREESDIKDALSSGAWRVVLGSKAIEDIKFAKDCIDLFKEQVIISVDEKGFKPRVRGWVKEVDMGVFDFIKKIRSFGAGEMIYTDIQKDGMMAGPSASRIKKVLREVKIKMILAGGISSLEDIIVLKGMEKIGLSGVIVGRALYEGKLDLKEAINACKKDNTLS